MRFHLVDRILEVQSGRFIRAAKNLTLGEDYLADHFPTFPVMPGVLMLQALVEAGTWLWRITDEFRYSVIVLRETKNVKYGTFMEPGRQMLLTAELLDQEEDLARFKGKGEVDGNTTVAARYTLARYNLRDCRPGSEQLDARTIAELRALYEQLKGDIQADRSRNVGFPATCGVG
jgi:3-hydroxyacyl-[acyl-carrier-protein] dehydratase